MKCDVKKLTMMERTWQRGRTVYVEEERKNGRRNHFIPSSKLWVNWRSFCTCSYYNIRCYKILPSFLPSVDSPNSSSRFESLLILILLQDRLIIPIMGVPWWENPWKVVWNNSWSDNLERIYFRLKFSWERRIKKF